MVAHCKFDLQKAVQNPNATFAVNMQIWGCETNEDIIGKVCRLSRKVSSRLPSQRTLELVLTKSNSPLYSGCPGCPCLGLRLPSLIRDSISAVVVVQP